MEPTGLEKYFSAADFTVFFALLTMSASIGLYFGYKDKNKRSIETYNFGDRNVSPLAVAMSMAVSFKSAITIIAFPVETYFHGIMLLWIVVGSLIGVAIGVVYFIPLIFRLQVKSVYEYLELRYNELIRRLCSGIYVVKLVMYLGVTMYVPALALNSVTPLDLSWSIAVTSLICTFYTTLGGIKAVIWTDVVQGIIMLLGPLILAIKATADVGGFGAVIDAASKGRRLNFSHFYSDIRMRSSGAAYFIGFLALATDTSSFTQVYAQRYLSCKSVKAARRAGMLRLIPTSLFVTLAIANGLIMYAYYEGCDPFGAGYVIKKDQLTPRFAVEVFQPLPGLAGLFVAAAYSGTLSTVSSGINALAAITSQDFLYPCWTNLPKSREPIIVKALTVFFGCLVTCVAYLISTLQYTIVQVSLGLLGVFRGPVFAVFIMGTMCPWSNEKGALAGIVVGGAFTAWCCIGRMFNDVSPRFTQTLPLTVDECYLNATSSTMNFRYFNSTMVTSTANESLHHRSILNDSLYSISPYFYSPMGFLVGVVTILIVSGITGFNKPKEMKPELFVPLVDNERIFPKSIVKFFRFGVPAMKQPGEIISLQENAIKTEPAANRVL